MNRIEDWNYLYDLNTVLELKVLIIGNIEIKKSSLWEIIDNLYAVNSFYIVIKINRYSIRAKSPHYGK